MNVQNFIIRKIQYTCGNLVFQLLYLFSLKFIYFNELYLQFYSFFWFFWISLDVYYHFFFINL
ncbi:hypothetical protein GLOIN_2v1586829, partial [Rhizophagus irregularis DAOM 181602=DAOM 197198]